METGAPFNRCIECEHIITNPICTDCLAQRMKVVVGEYNQSLAEEIHGCGIEGETPCIMCGKKMALCAHCFSRDVYDYLNEKDSNIAKEFVSRFDFDLRKDLVSTAAYNS